MSGILYTQAQVDNAQLRAQAAMYEISLNIENGFYYFGSGVYQSYKALQYDIYTLFKVIGNEEQYVTFNPTPTAYEMDFYDLVGSLINKTKQFDVFGQFGGVQNPNYQPPPGTIINVETQFTPLLLVRNQGDLIDAGGGNWYLPFNYDNGSAIVNGGIPVSVIVNGVSLSFIFDETTIPARIYGFANNNMQTIIVTVLFGAQGPTPPPPATQVINWGWFATDPYATINTATFLFTGNIAVNPNSYTLNFTNSANNQWLAVQELATNPVKTQWFNTVFNFGTIPDSVQRAAVVIGLYRYYVSRIQVALPTGQTSLTYTV